MCAWASILSAGAQLEAVKCHDRDDVTLLARVRRAVGEEDGGVALAHAHSAQQLPHPPRLLQALQLVQRTLLRHNLRIYKDMGIKNKN